MKATEIIDLTGARRLALARAGLLKPKWTQMPSRAAGRGKRSRAAALQIIRRFGYLQLDTVSVAGVRSHAMVLLSRLENFDPAVADRLLRPKVPLFEYWGHEASWIPMEMYPLFAFRRQEYREHPWWGDLVAQNPQVADELRRRLREEGPFRSADLEGVRPGAGGWWNLKVANQVALQLWSSGELAIRERRKFQRVFDLAENVIPEDMRLAPEPPLIEAFGALLERALGSHGWATAATLADTWRLKDRKEEVRAALQRLAEEKRIQSCILRLPSGRNIEGWIRPQDLELIDRLRKVRPRKDRGVLLSPFDPILTNRPRVRLLFGFDQVLEVYKPGPQRRYGYYCLPVLAGERLIARMDLKADRKTRLMVLACHGEDGTGNAEDQEAVRSALDRYASALNLPTQW